MREDSTLVVFATLAGGAVLKYAAFVYLSRKAQQMKYQFVGKVSELLVYPIKSCRGMTMESTHCNRLGVWHQGVGDRIKTDTIESLDCGDIAANWFNRYLKLDGLRLHFSPKSMAKRDASKAVKNWSHDAKPGDIVNIHLYELSLCLLASNV
ncbi:hypothetical protein KUTeg_013661 [Tegillarca granosa]|uniref:Molybdenum cofactor sulfurase middle domain-containing protein n=1 Tax=Tegillarca granosa TaxID=220873 RepID=A0ABQ9EYU8_TEGGR|nr:hypothetical protein KUTeg_013661 [Tegillarca granosa]